MKKPFERTVSVYTCCTNAIDGEFTLFEGLAQALEFCDEFVYVDGGSTDGTSQIMRQIEGIEPRVKVVESPWNEGFGRTMTTLQKNVGIVNCTKKLCMLLDADEVYDEGVVTLFNDPKVYDFLARNPQVAGLRFGVAHLYGTYEKRCLRDPMMGYPYYQQKVYGFRNHTGVHHGDVQGDPDILVDNANAPIDCSEWCGGTVYHYGHVRSKEAYLWKKNAIERRFHPDWVDLITWDWAGLMSGHDEYFIGFPERTSGVSPHPKVMEQRMATTVDERGFVKREEIRKYYMSYVRNLIGTVIPQIQERRGNE